MTDADKDKSDNYFESIKNLSAEELMSKVDSYLDDEAIEIFVEHIEDFYGIEDDEQLGMLAQIMVQGKQRLLGQVQVLVTVK